MDNLNKRPWIKFYPNQKDLKLQEIPLYSILEQAVMKHGERTAVIYEHKKMTYLELKDKVNRLAFAWKELGVHKGDRIGLMLGNHPDYIISYYAAQALGMIVVQINPMYTPRELLEIVIDSGISCIVTDPYALKTVREVCELYDFQYIFLSQMNNDEKRGKYHTLNELKGHPKYLEKPADISVREDVAVIQYTGGTTGKMKGVMLTHFNIVTNLIQSYCIYGDKMIYGQEVVLVATPLYHVYAMTSAMNLGIYIGGTLLLYKKLEVGNILEDIKKYRPTYFPGVPRMYNLLINHPKVESYGLGCLKICSCGSAPLPVEVIKRFEKLTGATIYEGYGLSEASPSTHRNPYNGMRKVGSIGIPLPGTDCKIVDDSGQEHEPGTIGELLIKGPQVMKGYWDNEEETNSALQNEWLYTGDLAIMDEDGYFYIVGRKKEMIIMGGFNVYPQEVEGVLYEHPHIKEAAVVGIPDNIHGETVKAFIVPKDGCPIDLEEIKCYCYLKLTRYKVPKEFEIRDSLPRNTVGKILKRLLIKEYYKS